METTDKIIKLSKEIGESLDRIASGITKIEKLEMHIVGMQGKIKSQEHEIALLRDRLRAERQININLTDKLQGSLESSERLRKHLVEKTEEISRLKIILEHMRRSIRGIY